LELLSPSTLKLETCFGTEPTTDPQFLTGTLLPFVTPKEATTALHSSSRRKQSYEPCDGQNLASYSSVYKD